MDVSKNRGTPKWMVYNGKPLLKWMIWGIPPFKETSIWPFSMQETHRKPAIEGLGWIPGWDVAVDVSKLLLMDKIPNNHLGWLFYPINYGIIIILWWCRILSINSILRYFGSNL